MVSAIEIGIDSVVIIRLEHAAFPDKDISRCPAMRFAVKRILSVTGRIKLLRSSITTINGASINGVPDGIRWIRDLDGVLIQAVVKTANHRASAVGRLMMM